MVKWLDVGIYCPQLMEMIRFHVLAIEGGYKYNITTYLV